MDAIKHLITLLLLFTFNCPSTHCDLIQDNKRYYNVKKIQMPIDHFSFSQNDTFDLKYLVNNTYWRNGPIFFYTGNEGSIELFAKHSGFIWDIAEEFEALIVFAEHRYYGESLPFGNKSFSDLSHVGYLTSSQALADYVELISHLQPSEAERQYPVIAFGGSYGGMLSAYLRMKYPHKVVGAIAASAPILQFNGMVPCNNFYRVASSSFKIANKYCNKNIYKSWAAIRNVTKTAEGKVWLKKEWNLCTDLKNDTSIDILLDYLREMYTTLAMVNYPYASDFMVPLPADPVRYVCQYLSEKSVNDTTLLQNLAKVIQTFTNYTGKSPKCFDYEGSTYNGDLGDLGWDFQACTEMVMPMCSYGDGNGDMFEAMPWDLNKFSSECKKKWNITPRINLAADEYGGMDIKSSSNIVFSNGLLDPWASGGVLSTLTDSIQAVLIPEGAHHLDLMGKNPSDPYSVRVARDLHKANIRKWINVFNTQRRQFVKSG